MFEDGYEKKMADESKYKRDMPGPSDDMMVAW